MDPSTEADRRRKTAIGAGIGVDASGAPVVDPTFNVIALVEANAKAVSDLRHADNRYYDKVMETIKERGAMDRRHLAEVAQIRAEYQKEIRESDLKVAAQTRLVDVGGQAASAASLATAVVALQGITDRNAETLRQAVQASATALAKQVTDIASATAQQTGAYNAAMETRVSSLEKGSNIGAGRQGVLDPQMSALVEKMDRLITLTAAGGGVNKGVGLSANVVAVVAAILISAAGLYASLKPSASSSLPPIVVNVPPLNAPTATKP